MKKKTRLKAQKMFSTKMNFPNLKKDVAIKAQKAFRTSNRLEWKKKSLLHIIIKTLNVQNK